MKRTPLPRPTKPLARSTKPIPKRRKTPRRGRVVDIPFLDWMATQPCCVTGRRPATTHHVREFGSQKNDRRAIRLVAELHLHEAGNFSIERIGKDKFEERWGINIEDEIAKVNARYRAETGRP